MKLSEVIEKELQNMILNDMESGQKLPSENELAASFDVSRSSVREALQSLEAKRMVERRNGGTYIISSADESFVAPLSLMIRMNFARPDELFDMRVLLETEAERLACQNIDDEYLRQYENLVWMMQKPGIGLEEFSSLDKQAHTLIAEASGNAVLCTFIKDVNTVLSVMQDELCCSLSEERLPVIVAYHKKVLSGLKERDSDKALGALTSHLADCRRLLLSSLENRQNPKGECVSCPM